MRLFAPFSFTITDGYKRCDIYGGSKKLWRRGSIPFGAMFLSTRSLHRSVLFLSFISFPLSFPLASLQQNPSHYHHGATTEKLGIDKHSVQTESAREARKSFYCELCSKGYARMNEFEAHEGSYDHLHKKVGHTPISQKKISFQFLHSLSRFKIPIQKNTTNQPLFPSSFHPLTPKTKTTHTPPPHPHSPQKPN